MWQKQETTRNYLVFRGLRGKRRMKLIIPIVVQMPSMQRCNFNTLYLTYSKLKTAATYGLFHIYTMFHKKIEVLYLLQKERTVTLTHQLCSSKHKDCKTLECWHSCVILNRTVLEIDPMANSRSVKRPKGRRVNVVCVIQVVALLMSALGSF